MHPNYDEGYSWQRARARARTGRKKREKKKNEGVEKDDTVFRSFVRLSVLPFILSLSRSRFDVLKRLTVLILWMDYVRYSWAKDHCHYHTCTRMIHVDGFRRLPVYWPCRVAAVDSAWTPMRRCDES